MTASAQSSSACKLAQVPDRFVRNHVKTRMCSFFLQNKCLRGNSCKFAHNQSELRSAPDYSKTRFCEVFFQTGVCSTGEACMFAHSQEELRVRDPSKAPQLPSGRFAAISTTTTTWKLSLPASVAASATPGVQSEEESKDSKSDSDSDSDSGDDEPLVTKNLTASTACTAATGNRRRSWADIMDGDDDFDFDSDDYSQNWSPSCVAGFSSLSAPTSEASVSPFPAKAASRKVQLEVSQKAADKEDHEDKDKDEEIVVEYVVKRSFFHLQPATANPRFRRFASLN
mmetsp:Transcript_79927/g.166162  ORF Transcript_79927/g.166162 Transcript_79927/m.166162 type:complete len:284 (+) Transcript_79927:78-929(+)